MAGQPTIDEVRGWAAEVDAVGQRIARHFAHSEPRQRAVGNLRGLLSDANRKNGWQLAEHLGDSTPNGVQHLLARADWDADAVRDDLMGYVTEYLGEAVRKLLLKLVWSFVPAAEQVLGWLVWRRRHQRRARACHYRRRGATPRRLATAVGLARVQ